LEGPATARRNHDILPDGRRFVGVVPAAQTKLGAVAGPEIRVVLNWHEELIRRVPVP
jgi:hypothetical protein